MFARSLAGLLLICAISRPALADDSADAKFAEATQQYASGKFKEAISGFEELAQARKWSPNLFYDLGNAYYRTSEFGQAILSYERALALESNHPEAQANLRLAREEARALEMSSPLVERALRFGSPRVFTIGAACLFWIGAFVIAASLLGQRRRRTRLALGVFCLLAASALGYLVFTIDHGPRGSGLAIIVGGQTQARAATADTATSVLLLPVGSEVKVEQQRGDWVYAELPNNQRGWIPAKNVESVRLD